MDVEDVLSEVNIDDYIGQYVDLTIEGNDLFGLCPFHNEDTPSFSVTPSRGLWWCFGCHKGGSVLTFVQKYHHLGFEDALKHLCAYAGVSEPAQDKRLLATKIIKRFKPSKRTEKVATYKKLDDGIMSLYERDLSKLAEWIDEGIPILLLDKYQVRYDPFENRLVYPVRSVGGAIINICGRTLDPDWKQKKTKKYRHYYKMGVLDTFCGYYEHEKAIRDSKEIILFEGLKSVMIAESWGVDNACAVCTSHLNPEQRKILIKLGARVVFALDSEVDVAKDEEITKLRRYVQIETVINRDGLLKDKMSPVDAGHDVWKSLYERRVRLN